MLFYGFKRICLHTTYLSMIGPDMYLETAFDPVRLYFVKEKLGHGFLPKI